MDNEAPHIDCSPNNNPPHKSPLKKIQNIIGLLIIFILGVVIGHFVIPKSTNTAETQTNTTSTVSTVSSTAIEAKNQEIDFTLIKPFNDRKVCLGQEDYIAWTAPKRYKDIFIFVIAPDGSRSILNYKMEGTTIRYSTFPVSSGDSSRDFKVGARMWTVGEVVSEKLPNKIVNLSPAKGYKFEVLEVHLKEKTITHEFEIANCSLSPTP